MNMFAKRCVQKNTYIHTYIYIYICMCAYMYFDMSLSSFLFELQHRKDHQDSSKVFGSSLKGLEG